MLATFVRSFVRWLATVASVPECVRASATCMHSTQQRNDTLLSPPPKGFDTPGQTGSRLFIALPRRFGCQPLCDVFCGRRNASREVSAVTRCNELAVVRGGPMSNEEDQLTVNCTCEIQSHTKSSRNCVSFAGTLCLVEKQTFSSFDFWRTQLWLRDLLPAPWASKKRPGASRK